jgi:ectoine hydroxylase-related dioxygenase (phytanoyl-CoA dioxygenase family)
LLSAAQQAHFETFGFIVLRQAFNPDEVARITREFDQGLAEDRRGEEFSGERRQAVFAVVEKRMPWLVEDDRIYEAIEQLLGLGFVWIGSDSNLYVGDTGWHPDGSMLSYGRIKVAFYLDPVGKDTGCLRVIPGSHKPPLHEDLKPLSEQRQDPTKSPFGVEPRDVPCFPLESQPGDVVFFNQNTWHSSFGGRTGRRMFTLNFGAKPTMAEQIEYLRRTYQSNIKNVQTMQSTDTGRVYDDAFLGSNRPRIRGMVEKLVELGFK